MNWTCVDIDCAVRAQVETVDSAYHGQGKLENSWTSKKLFMDPDVCDVFMRNIV